MPLPVLGALVFFGIGGLVLLVHLFGWTKRPCHKDEDAARSALLSDYPEAEIKEVFLADDRRSALFALADGLGYAAPFGEGRLTRVFGPGDIRAVEEAAQGLVLRPDDFTAPRLVVAMSSAKDRAVWKKRLEMGEAP